MKKTITILLLLSLLLASGCAPFVLSTSDINNTTNEEPVHIRFAKPVEEPTYETCSPIDQSHIQEILELTNKERAAHGLPELTLSPTISKIAQIRAVDMADNSYFDHVSASGETVYSLLQDHKVFYFSSAENIGKGNVSCERMVAGWMDSEGHRKAILSRLYHQIGIGIVEASNGEMYWVQVFIN
ncbi:MAG: hypothetical protein HN948_09545 [Clostridia bacterium]|nr:hypothetical protein [Clostridia bacterium]MBT7123236.1 hypothetical protein [Clostridia bacterium]